MTSALTPPFDLDTAIQKVRFAEDAWNSRDPERVVQAYTMDSVWRNRSTFIYGRMEIEHFLHSKWQNEKNYRLIKELWLFAEDKIAVRFAYEWQTQQGSWFRSYGNENWHFDSHGLMKFRVASVNDKQITEEERLFHWPLGKRPALHPSLTQLGL